MHAGSIQKLNHKEVSHHWSTGGWAYNTSASIPYRRFQTRSDPVDGETNGSPQVYGVRRKRHSADAVGQHQREKGGFTFSEREVRRPLRTSLPSQRQNHHRHFLPRTSTGSSRPSMSLSSMTASYYVRQEHGIQRRDRT